MTGCITKKASRFCLFLCLLTKVVFVHAQQANSFSLQQLVNKAMQYSPALQSKEALVKSSVADIKSIKDDYLPTAVIGDEALIGSDNSLPGSYLSMGLIPSTSSGIRSDNVTEPATGNFALLQSQYDLTTFGYKNARLKNASAIVDLRKDDLNRDAYLLKWRLSKLYFELREQQLQVSIEAQNVNRYQELFNIIKAITVSGLKPGADSSEALAELSKTKIEYNDALKQMQLYKQDISYLTGIRVDSIIADTSAIKNQSSVTNLMSGLPDTSVNPILHYYNTMLNLLQSDQQVISKSFNPRLVLSATAWARGSSIDYADNYKSLATGLGYQRYNYMAGVSLFYDLFNGVKKHDRLVSNSFNIDAGNYDLQQEKQALDNASNQADVTIQTASNDLAEIPVQLRAANDAFNQKTAQYKAGIINLVDLTNATYVLYRAQTDYAKALNEWFLANVDKAAVTGNLDLFIQSLNY